MDNEKKAWHTIANAIHVSNWMRINTKLASVKNFIISPRQLNLQHR